MKTLAEARIAVIGLGLMGGSLAAALRGRCAQIIGFDRRPETVVHALKLGIIDTGAPDLQTALREVDSVVLATPVRTIIHLLDEIAVHLPDGCLVLDLGSTKAEVLKAMERLPPRVQPLGGHPMCGKEISGIEAADARLFQGRTFILSPLQRTSPEALAQGEALARAVGATPLVIDGVRQDYLVAAISHLPYLLACALVSTADATVSADPLVWQIVAGGFRDTSRVAGSDPAMMTDIMLTNRDEVLKALELCTAHMEHLTALVARGDPDELCAAFGAIRRKRQEMYA